MVQRGQVDVEAVDVEQNGLGGRRHCEVRVMRVFGGLAGKH